jgi:hypothetical protein
VCVCVPAGLGSTWWRSCNTKNYEMLFACEQMLFITDAADGVTYQDTTMLCVSKP